MMLGALALLVGFAWAEAAALRRWHGVWLLVAMVPLAIMLFVVMQLVVDPVRDPTSHDLWPFELVMWSGFGLVVLAVAAGLQPLVRGPEP